MLRDELGLHVRIMKLGVKELRLTAVSIGRRVVGGRNCVARYECSERDESLRAAVTNLTYSLSVLVVRTSGSLPSRPTNMSFATSPERAEVVEKPCGKIIVSIGYYRSLVEILPWRPR